jgi:hypothetical protein
MFVAKRCQRRTESSNGDVVERTEKKKKRKGKTKAKAKEQLPSSAVVEQTTSRKAEAKKSGKAKQVEEEDVDKIIDEFTKSSVSGEHKDVEGSGSSSSVGAPVAWSCPDGSTYCLLMDR